MKSFPTVKWLESKYSLVLFMQGNKHIIKDRNIYHQVNNISLYTVYIYLETIQEEKHCIW